MEIATRPAKSGSKEGKLPLNLKALKKSKQLPPPPPKLFCPLATSHICSVEFTISGPSSVPLVAAHIFDHQPLSSLLPSLLASLTSMMRLPESPTCCPLPYCNLSISSFSSHMRQEHQFELLCCHLVLLGGQQGLLSALIKACNQSRVRQFLRFELLSLNSFLDKYIPAGSPKIILSLSKKVALGHQRPLEEMWRKEKNQNVKKRRKKFL